MFSFARHVTLGWPTQWKLAIKASQTGSALGVPYRDAVLTLAPLQIFRIHSQTFPIIECTVKKYLGAII
jgi:hypothetical protein